MMNVAQMSVKELVANRTVEFVHYAKGNLWYRIDGIEDFDFPVPLEDAGDGMFKRTDKAMFFMRYIRKQLSYLKEAQSKK